MSVSVLFKRSNATYNTNKVKLIIRTATTSITMRCYKLDCYLPQSQYGGTIGLSSMTRSRVANKYRQWQMWGKQIHALNWWKGRRVKNTEKNTYHEHDHLLFCRNSNVDYSVMQNRNYNTTYNLVQYTSESV